MTQLTKRGKTLFDFQRTCVDEVQKLIDSGDRTILLISLMGSGKTAMATHLIREHLRAGKRCLFLVDFTVLIRQVCAEMAQWEIPFTVLQADKYFDKDASVIIASAQTLEARLRSSGIEELLGNLDLVIYDEAHNLTYRQVAQKLHSYYSGSCLSEIQYGMMEYINV